MYSVGHCTGHSVYGPPTGKAYTLFTRVERQLGGGRLPCLYVKLGSRRVPCPFETFGELSEIAAYNPFRPLEFVNGAETLRRENVNPTVPDEAQTYYYNGNNVFCFSPGEKLVRIAGRIQGPGEFDRCI